MSGNRGWGMGERFVQLSSVLYNVRRFFFERCCDGSFPHHSIKTALTIKKETKKGKKEKRLNIKK